MNKINTALYKTDRRTVALIGSKAPVPLDLSNVSDLSVRQALSWRALTQQLGHGMHFTCMNDVTVCKCFGFDVFKVKDGSEHVSDNQIICWEDVKRLDVAQALKHSAVQRTIAPFIPYKELDEETIVGGGCFGPLTVAGAMLGVENLNVMTVTNAGLVHGLLRKITAFMSQLAMQCRLNGADYVWIAEPLAVMLSPNNFMQFSGSYIKEIFETANIPGFLHVCGDTTLLNEGLVATGAKCLSLDYQVDLRNTAQSISTDVVLMGNINPVFVKQASIEQIAEETAELLYQMRNFPNFMFSTGCLLPGSTPIENIKVIYDVVNSYATKTEVEYQSVLQLMALFVEQDYHSIINQIDKFPVSLIPDALEEALITIGNAYMTKQLSYAEFLKKVYDLQLVIKTIESEPSRQIRLKDACFDINQETELVTLMTTIYADKQMN